MRYVCPTGDIARNHRERMIAFCTRYNLYLPDEDFSYQFVLHLMDDLINDRLYWQTCSTNKHLELVEQIEARWRQDSGLSDQPRTLRFTQDKFITQRFDIEVNSETYDTLRLTISCFLPEKTWKTISHKHVVGNTVFHIGEDYRILDWNNRVEAGEIPCARQVRKYIR